MRRVLYFIRRLADEFAQDWYRAATDTRPARVIENLAWAVSVAFAGGFLAWIGQHPEDRAGTVHGGVIALIASAVYVLTSVVAAFAAPRRGGLVDALRRRAAAR